ncbi:eukaryotic translation initiation factor 4 gamma 3 isoform X3 [Aethina tumida]|uniref:eukaryotic translation initiation factor 4 gamma 3 isoform X3 n=1 Tax=Aethina tumida TaxID=116153 RepID=UPI0021480610|nr:eukaryotic translation initiation factor 4 gamma 3 isoform X3 [Aethina tumida]
MSGNQKQAAPVGPPGQRFTSQNFPNVLQQQPRPEGYAVNPPTQFIPPQPNQGGNQGPGLRAGIPPPSGPPNQASTPPNADLKVQQTTSMYRQNQNYYRQQGPQTQTQRMPNHNRPPQSQIYPGQPNNNFMHLSSQQQIYVPYLHYPPSQRQSYMQPMIHNLPGGAYPFHLNVPQTPPPAQYFYNHAMMRPQAPPQTASAPPNAVQQQSTVHMGAPPLQQAAQQHATYQRQQKTRRQKAIPIIDPDTGKDRLTELFDESSHPASGESSARQTPQPTPQQQQQSAAAAKEVQSTFARLVAQSINVNTSPMSMETGSSGSPVDYHHPGHHPGHHTVGHGPSAVPHHQMHQPIHHGPVHQQPPHQQPPHHHNLQQVEPTLQHHDAVINEDPIDPTHYPPPPGSHPPSMDGPAPHRNIDLASNSKLKPLAKEFVSHNKPSSQNKETPIVSANCDSAEVTIPPKQSKDRESPAKGGRKHKERAAAAAAAAAAEKEKAAAHEREAVAPVAEPVPVVADKPANQPAPAVGSGEGGVAPKEQKKEEVKVEAEVQQPQENTKSKQNHANKIQQSNKQLQNQKNSAVSVPPPQPKANSKGNKKNEINLKGASKEGSDMDAISDTTTIIQNEDAINANIKTSDLINSNTLLNNSNIPAPVTDNAATIEDNVNKQPPQQQQQQQQQQKTVTTTKNENAVGAAVPPPAAVKTPSAPAVEKPAVTKKQPFSVTNIVKDPPPRTVKLSVPAPAAAAEADETDRAGLSNERLVQAKNEANAKEAAGNSTAPALKYEDGQWSPFNKDGKKVYNRDFLMGLKNAPASKVKPDNILDVIVAEEGSKRPQENRYGSMGGNRPDFANLPYGKSSSQRGGMPQKRNSQSGKLGGSGKNNKPSGKVSISLSLRDDVKLNVTENAWKPARLVAGTNLSDEDRKTAELYKKVRGVLNKLTPQKFDTLLMQVRSLKISTCERLQGVIDLVFEKAVDEPNFSVAYALMCRELAMLQVPVSNSNSENPEFVNFRKLLVTRCQAEFEKQSVDETERARKVKEIEECTDPEKKKDLQFELEEYDRRVRMKSVGNIRFIGELFKQQMLTVNIMIRCLSNLLENKDEESLECLCKLLTTIGKELESKSVNLDQIFKVMKEIVDRKHQKVSSRVRFMLQDVIDLRSSKWVPRRQDLNPKTIDQIQKEAADEQMNIAAMNNAPTPRKDDRGSMGMNSERNKRGKSVSDDGWISNSRSSRITFSVQSDKLKNKPPQVEEMSLGSSNTFSNWGQGSHVKNSAPPDKKSGSGRRGGDAYHSKGPSLERNNMRLPYDGRGSRSGSQNRYNDGGSSQSSQRSTPAPVAESPAPLAPSQVSAPPQQQPSTAPTVAPSVPSGPIEVLTEEQLERRFKNSLDEYINNNIGAEEFDQEVKGCVPTSYIPTLINNCFFNVLEKSKVARVKTSQLFAKLLQLETISLEDFSTGLQETLEAADDMVIDIPMFWQYMAEMLCSVVCEEAVPLARLRKMISCLSEDNHYKFMGTLFKLVVETKNADFLKSIWVVSELKLSDIIGKKDPEQFVKDFNLEFLNEGNAPGFTFDQVQVKMTEFFITKASLDDIYKWIETNVGAHVKENKFIRALVTAIFKDCVKQDTLNLETFQRHMKLLQKYIDNNPMYELQCLYAIQALVHKMEHPKGLLLSICTNFYENWVISSESFLTWESSTDPAEQGGKGVALMQLTCFLNQLKEDLNGSESDE